MSGRFLTVADVGDDSEGAAHKPVMLNAQTGDPFAPNGTLGFRYSASGLGPWHLDPGGTDPVLTVYGRREEAVPVDLPRFDIGQTESGGVVRRGVPAAGRLVTTVLDLLMAQYAVGRDGPPRRVGGRLRRRGHARQAGLAGADHRRTDGRRGPGGAGVRAQRRAVAGPVDDLHGGGHQPLVPLRPERQVQGEELWRSPLALGVVQGVLAGWPVLGGGGVGGVGGSGGSGDPRWVGAGRRGSGEVAGAAGGSGGSG
ncbi:MAG: hypothetical protein ACRDRJ_43000, partial [Streptosporangiaceae bacterium]